MTEMEGRAADLLDRLKDCRQVRSDTMLSVICLHGVGSGLKSIIELPCKLACMYAIRTCPEYTHVTDYRSLLFVIFVGS